MNTTETDTRYRGVSDDISEYFDDPDYIDDIRDPLRAAKDLLCGFLLGIPFWGLVCGLLALVNKYIGGG